MTRLTSEAFRRTEGPLPLRIKKVTEEVASQPAPDEVLVQIHAVALNSRDVAMLRGTYQAPSKTGGIIASDCAAEVLAVGSAVHDFEVGDRVSPTFFTNLTTGDENEPPKALGGDEDGVLRRYALFPSTRLIHLPAHLSWEEVSHWLFFPEWASILI
jgi:NADPH:quinone reductase-like Zn-dependent oxidoreductase